MLRTTVAAFRLIPYISRKRLDDWAREMEAWEKSPTREGNSNEEEDHMGDEAEESD